MTKLSNDSKHAYLDIALDKNDVLHLINYEVQEELLLKIKNIEEQFNDKKFDYLRSTGIRDIGFSLISFDLNMITVTIEKYGCTKQITLSNYSSIYIGENKIFSLYYFDALEKAKSPSLVRKPTYLRDIVVGYTLTTDTEILKTKKLQVIFSKKIKDNDGFIGEIYKTEYLLLTEKDSILPLIEKALISANTIYKEYLDLYLEKQEIEYQLLISQDERVSKKKMIDKLIGKNPNKKDLITRLLS